jgi:2-amino-4-hydroxy-6-hydroxymethyldihydropteridine diphosphokinase
VEDAHSTPRGSLACIGLGANLGDRAATIRDALDALRRVEGVVIEAISSLRETPAVTLAGADPQPDYLNAAAILRTTLPPERLLRRLLDVEASLGRRRAMGERWAPRTIDLDLLLFADQVVDLPGCRVPHPSMHERRFVLEPLAEIAPGAKHPILRRTVSELLADLDAAPLNLEGGAKQRPI